ncbi:MAG: ChbG/HpnK family deacetylase [Ruminococcaceae bacterium]|nr:ChbG/HpnK family deacetylase [Oscillospiraceae bacterium]
MKKLIITADDYGMSRAVNDAIEAGIDAGLITSTNVMTNMPLYKEAIKLKDKKGLSVGIHWVLACGKPILSAYEIPTLVMSNGEFYPYPEFRKRLRKKLISFTDIKKELIAQYKLYYELMGQPDYWNTHQNTHVDFGIYRLFVDTAAELGINKMRSHQRIYVKGSDNSQKMSLKWRMIEPIKAAMLNNWQSNAHKKGISSPEGLIVCLNGKDINKPEYLFSHINWNKKHVGEYVIHPATENDSPYFGKIVDQRIREFEMFTSKKTKELISDAGIELVAYEGLK